ncbi:uncharacterized protein LOC122528127 [Frieseomelitta varia]|uniref:uncharacterized protein LOC122528127 n=1 Tax=Frieseomelitta varia TaxID=561572 RepID=UPI001CB68D8F|nr:uncharacterized protein LOC122528127 [Frieseomelitta varia]
MVIIHIKPSIVDPLKGKYTKGLWSKLKTLHTAMAKANPLVTYYSYIFIPFTIVVPIILYFGHRNEQYIPKYYEYIYIIRPDDPRVQRIRKDDSLRLNPTFMLDSIHMPGTI